MTCKRAGGHFSLPINSVTGSCSPSVLMVPAMLSFSKMGRKSCTKSEVYGGAMTSSTCKVRKHTPTSSFAPQADEMPVGL